MSGSSAAQHHQSSADLTCEEVSDLLPLVADGVLDADADPVLFAHLARCCECQEGLLRHDLVTVGLQCTRPSRSATKPPRRAVIRQVFLPWPAALAASLVAAASLWMWLASTQSSVVRPATETQVVQVIGADGQPVYVVVEGDRVTVIDPRAIDGKGPASQVQSTPVKFQTTPVRKP